MLAQAVTARPARQLDGNAVKHFLAAYPLAA